MDYNTLTKQGPWLSYPSNKQRELLEKYFPIDQPCNYYSSSFSFPIKASVIGYVYNKNMKVYLIKIKLGNTYNVYRSDIINCYIWKLRPILRDINLKKLGI